MLAQGRGALGENHPCIVAVVDHRHQHGRIPQFQPLDEGHHLRVEYMVAMVAPGVLDRAAALGERASAKRGCGEWGLLTHPPGYPVPQPARSEERSVGHECVSKCRSRW